MRLGEAGTDYMEGKHRERLKTQIQTEEKLNTKKQQQKNKDPDMNSSHIMARVSQPKHVLSINEQMFSLKRNRQHLVNFTITT